MKKFFAYSTVTLIFLVIAFKALHFPGVDELFILNTGLLIPIFYLVDGIADWKKNKYRFLLLLRVIGSIALSYGVLFKIMFWPLSTELLTLSIGILLPTYYITKALIEAQKSFKVISTLIFKILICFASLFTWLQYPGSQLLVGLALIFTLIHLIQRIGISEELKAELFPISNARHMLNLSAILALLFTFHANKLPIQIQDSEVTTQFDLQERIDQEIAFGDEFINEKNYPLTKEINRNTRKLLQLIDLAKIELLCMSNGNDACKYASPKNQSEILWKKAPNEPQIGIYNFNLEPVILKRNTDIASYLFIGNNMKQPDTYKYGNRIWIEWIAYQELLIATSNNSFDASNSLAQTSIAFLKRVEKSWHNKKYANYHGIQHVPWITRNFDKTTIIQAIVHLTQLQYEAVRLRTVALAGL